METNLTAVPMTSEENGEQTIGREPLPQMCSNGNHTSSEQLLPSQRASSSFLVTESSSSATNPANEECFTSEQLCSAIIREKRILAKYEETIEDLLEKQRQRKMQLDEGEDLALAFDVKLKENKLCHIGEKRINWSAVEAVTDILEVKKLKDIETEGRIEAERQLAVFTVKEKNRIIAINNLKQYFQEVQDQQLESFNGKLYNFVEGVKAQFEKEDKQQMKVVKETRKMNHNLQNLMKMMNPETLKNLKESTGQSNPKPDIHESQTLSSGNIKEKVEKAGGRRKKKTKMAKKSAIHAKIFKGRTHGSSSSGMTRKFIDVDNGSDDSLLPPCLSPHFTCNGESEGMPESPN